MIHVSSLCSRAPIWIDTIHCRANRLAATKLGDCHRGNILHRTTRRETIRAAHTATALFTFTAERLCTHSEQIPIEGSVSVQNKYNLNDIFCHFYSNEAHEKNYLNAPKCSSQETFKGITAQQKTQCLKTKRCQEFKYAESVNTGVSIKTVEL